MNHLIIRIMIISSCFLNARCYHPNEDDADYDDNVWVAFHNHLHHHHHLFFQDQVVSQTFQWSSSIITLNWFSFDPLGIIGFFLFSMLFKLLTYTPHTQPTLTIISPSSRFLPLSTSYLYHPPIGERKKSSQ